MPAARRERGDAIDAAADDEHATQQLTGNYATAHKAYTAAGWQGVLPLPPQSKMPPPKGCTGADGRWPSAADAYDWALTQPDDCNIALRLPPDVIGLDVDQYGDKRGRDNLVEAAMAHDLSPFLTTWRTSARDGTASGIYLYRVPAGTKLRGEAVPDVETIQHHHRFALVWPSVHPNGMPYRWRSPEGLTSTAVPHVDELPSLAADWIDFLADRLPDAIPANLPPPVEHREAVWAGAVQIEHAKARSALLVASPGSRHEIARDRCMALCRMEQDGLAGATAALDSLGVEFVNAVRLERGSDSEAAGEWRRMLDGGRQLARTTLTAAQIARDADRAATEALVAPGASEDATEAHSVDPCDDARVDWSAFWKRERVEDQYLVEPLLARGRGHAIYASAKVGKSLLMLEVAAACATGQTALDGTVAEPVDVVYLDMEMTEDDIRDRLVDLGYGPDDDLSRLHYYLLPSLPPLDTDQGGAVLDAIAAHRNAQLVVIDTMARVIEGEENNADTFKSFYRYTGSRLKRRGITYARLDHAGKDIEKGQRGSSAKVDDVDIVWRITSTDDGVRLKATHRRIKTVPEYVNLRRDSNPLRHTITGGSYAAGARELAARLDALNVPLDAGRAHAREALRSAGMTAANDVLSSAMRFRRETVEWIH